MTFKHINIIGFGYVGGGVAHLCKMNNVNFCTYDIVKKNDTGAVENFNDLNKLIEFSENNNELNVYFISVPTPSKENGECNTEIVENVISECNEKVTKKTIIIIKSTVKPGTTRKISNKITNANIEIVFCPEFLTEKNFKNDIYNAHFVLLGFNKINTNLYNDVGDVMKTLYKHNSEINVINKSYEECELFKYTLNTFFATKITFFNEIYELCETMGVDYQNLKSLFKLDKRIGDYGITVPGEDGKRGYGLSCLPKEIRGLVRLQEEFGLSNELASCVNQRNIYFRN